MCGRFNSDVRLETRSCSTDMLASRLYPLYLFRLWRSERPKLGTRGRNRTFDLSSSKEERSEQTD